MNELKEMKKDELIELCSEYEEALCYLDTLIGNRKVHKVGRKEQVMGVLQKDKRVTVGQIGAQLGMTCRNVSSYLCYLRKDGINIGTDSKGRKFIEPDEVNEVE
jgi:biotin operon repressor